ncbi:hypothetical protein FRC18_008016 [Serendipita sp. 400]|nr:hypothetical protein FRC18_008016 [Serendipita sp. 400]
MRLSLNDDLLLDVFKWFVAVDDDGPYKIFFLSKTWRRTVLSHPDLWSWITIDTIHEDWQERIHVAVVLSQNRTLNLKIICRGQSFPNLVRFQSSFNRIRTIALHALKNEHIISTSHYLYESGVMDNIDKIDRTPTGDSPMGEVATMYNIGILDWLKAQEWLKMHDLEPPMTASHPLIRDGILPANAWTVFEVFIEYYCKWAENGAWCRQTFLYKNKAVDHARSHLNYRPFVCHGACENNHCAERFPTREMLSIHIDDRSFTCKICGGCFFRRVDFTRHNEKVHKVPLSLDRTKGKVDPVPP